MYYFVKSEVPREKVDEFTRKLANHEIRPPEGNLSWVTTDGCVGYDIVECSDESSCRQKYGDLLQNGLRIDEMTPVEPMGKFIESFQSR